MKSSVAAVLFLLTCLAIGLPLAAGLSPGHAEPRYAVSLLRMPPGGRPVPILIASADGFSSRVVDAPRREATLVASADGSSSGVVDGPRRDLIQLLLAAGASLTSESEMGIGVDDPWDLRNSRTAHRSPSPAAGSAAPVPGPVPNADVDEHFHVSRGAGSLLDLSMDLFASVPHPGSDGGGSPGATALPRTWRSAGSASVDVPSGRTGILVVPTEGGDLVMVASPL